ncbi:tyrosine--tRNA ligase [Clostridium beijerinckii]|uniref:tyrosine--tRNA ligase n=1 Tax=Clostridium beijerinckii TaxID=1520 RepID=UPI0006867544|nr:tyrosine--tRNA ligase [Clostridium beijerinckii]
MQNILIRSIEEKLMNPEEDLTYLTAEEQFKRIMDKVSDLPDAVTSGNDLLDRLRKSKKDGIPLKIKFGIDPTGPEIHIGHCVSLINLRLFQRMGHKIVLVIGDFTAMIGDPSGRIEDRPPLTEEQVKINMATYEEQASRIINLKDTDIERYCNSSWMNKITMKNWVEIIKNISVSQLMQREDFRKRLNIGVGISLAELEYALFMGYDSVSLKPDIELGGVDQFLNLHMCRQMMEISKLKPEIIITYNLLSGTTGVKDDQGRLVKMSKSKGNYIPIVAEPSDMYGKVMSIPDEVMWIWFRELTEITSEDLKDLKSEVEEGIIHPKEAKQLLARVIVGTFNYFDKGIVAASETDFNQKFGGKSVLIPESTQMVNYSEGKSLKEVLSKESAISKSELVRLVQQKGVRMLIGENYEPVSIEDLSKQSIECKGNIFRVGKRKYIKII